MEIIVYPIFCRWLRCHKLDMDRTVHTTINARLTEANAMYIELEINRRATVARAHGVSQSSTP